MSGDVQPRKRKDKRRKKEGGSVGAIYEPEIIHKHKKSESDHKSFELPDQGEKIHVQSEHGIGGNFCVKIIFFCLFGLLVGAVGLIYLQSQGSTDVDLPTVEESRFAEYFTGWLDDSNDDHEHEILVEDVDNEHDEHDEHDEHEEHEEQEDNDDHEKEDQSAEQDSIFKLFGLQVDEEKEEPEETETTRESEETGIKDDKDEEDENLEDTEQEEDDDDLEEDKDDEDSEIDDDDDDASQVDENDEDDQKLNNSEEDGEISKESKYDDNEEEEEEADDEEVEDVALKEANENDKEDEVEDEIPSDDLGYDEIYESEEDEDLSKSEDKGEEEISDEGVENSEIEGEEEEEKATFVNIESTAKDEEENAEEPESGGVAVKLGVGIALVIVAHLVLVQKWKSMSNASTNETNLSEVKPAMEEKKNVANLTSETEPVISRRQTLVPENIFLNDEWEEQEEEEEEEEEQEEDEVDEDSYLEEDGVEEEKLKKIEDGNLESFEKLSWDDDKEVDEKDEFEEDVYNEDEEQEEADREEEEEEEEEDEDEGEEEEVENELEEDEYEEDMEEEAEDEFEDKRKKPYLEVVETSTRQEPKPEEATPTPVPPPRTHKGGRGAQDFDEDFFEEISKMEEIRQDGMEERGPGNVAEPEEPKPVETKPGNEDDWTFKEDFDFADEQFENNPKAAVQAYDKILSKKPTVLRALIGRARALDHLAEKEKSNAYLKQAISAYKSLILEHGRVLDDETFVNLSERCIDRIRFSGAFNSAVDVHKALIMKFPQTPKYRNSLSVTYLMMNRIPQARVLLNETLTLWPEDGLALVHYGFILKASDNNMEEGAKKLIAGIETNEKGVIDGFFFCHLGDALNRLGRGQEAMKWYERGVKEGLFLSKYQRSLYNVNRLKGQPWWTKEETTYQDFFRKLEQNWREIRREGLELLNSKGVNLFKIETENLTDTGDWRQLDLYFRGRKQATCNKAPITCGLVSSFKPASTCTRGQIKFSVMLPDTHVWPHCGPTNCRLRSHLGLVVPKKTYIRVAEETRSWEEGKFIIFDDSFEHEVWHNGTGLRLVLIVDVWHPELTNRERLTLSPI